MLALLKSPVNSKLSIDFPVDQLNFPSTKYLPLLNLYLLERCQPLLDVFALSCQDRIRNWE